MWGGKGGVPTITHGAKDGRHCENLSFQVLNPKLGEMRLGHGKLKVMLSSQPLCDSLNLHIFSIYPKKYLIFGACGALNSKFYLVLPIVSSASRAPPGRATPGMNPH